MKLPRGVRERFQAYGREGGLTRAARMSPEDRRSVAVKAAIRRWVRARFGGDSFESLGLPGGDVIDRGLAQLAAGVESVESLVVSLAAPRLRREGVPLPRMVFPHADHRLYDLIRETGDELAHARYLAHLRQAASFADACALLREARDSRA